MTPTEFENPQNGYREQVTWVSGLLAILFGWIYWAIKGMWGVIGLHLTLTVLAGVISGGPGALIGLPLQLALGAYTPEMLRKTYLRQGWKPTAYAEASARAF